MSALFVYGSLQLDAVVLAACGRLLSGEPARLDGYRRALVRGERYPAIVADAAAATAGRLLRGVEAQTLELLDRFEGPSYQRRPVRVRLDGSGDEVGAQAYLLAPHARGELTSEPWDLERFEKEDLEAFLAHYRGFVEE